MSDQTDLEELARVASRQRGPHAANLIRAAAGELRSLRQQVAELRLALYGVVDEDIAAPASPGEGEQPARVNSFDEDWRDFA